MAPDLKDVLRTSAAQPADRLDLDDVRRRARTLRQGRRLRVIAAGVGVVALVAVAATPLIDLLQRPAVEFADPPPSDQDVPPDRGGIATKPWQRLPAAPIKGRSDVAGVWTGEEMVVWGGLEPARDHRAVNDGAAYNPATRTWRTLPDAPVALTGEPSAVWTGYEMLMWGPAGNGAVAAAYDPASNEWRTLPDPPIAAQHDASTIWTGSEMIVWGGHDTDGEESRGGAAYSLERDAWRELPEAPIPGRFRHGAVWTGAEMVVWGGTAGDAGSARTFDDGAAYAPIQGTWRTLPDGPLSAQAPAAAIWTGHSMVVLGDATGDSGTQSQAAAALDPDGGRWRRLADVGMRRLTSFAKLNDRILAWGPDAPAPVAIDAGTGYYTVLWTPPTPLGKGAAAVWTGDRLIIWGGLDARSRAVDRGVTFNPSTLPSLETVRGVATEDAEGVGSFLEPTEAGGLPTLWPYPGDKGPWQERTDALAEVFGRDVLGWDDAQVTDGEPSEDGHMGERLTLSSRKVDSSVGLLVWPDEPVPGAVRDYDGPYSVASVTVAGGDQSRLSVDIRGDRGRVAFAPRGDTLPGAAKAVLRVQYGQGFGATHDLATGPPWEFRPTLDFPREEPGSLLILIEDAKGNVIGAQGMGLPAGDFTTD